MKDDNALSRRHFIQRLGLFGAAGLGASTLLAACGGGDDAPDADADMDADAGMTDDMAAASCDDVSGLDQAQLQQRQQSIENLEYVAETPNSEQNCANCQLYVADQYGDACGGCQIIPGPVAAEGWCKSWVAAAT